MNILFLVIASISAISWVCLGVLFFGTMRKKHIFRGTAFSGEGIIYPSLSIVIAACNEEESIEQAVTQLINQDYHDFEVIVVNDRSTDRTGGILAELDIKYPQLKVITITNLPPNWLGKNHAIYQGVKYATGEWLLFTDADVMFSPDSLKKTISYSLENNLDHLTIGPDIPHKGYIYGGFIAFLTLVITFLFIGSKSAGLGAFNLIKKSTYNAIGGHEALAMQPVDDFSLGKLVVKRGYKQSYDFSKGLISVKIYDNISGMIKGLEKNQFAGANYNVSTTLATCSLLLFLHVYPFIGILFGSWLSRVLCGISIIMVFAIYNTSRKYMPISLSHFLIHPISASLYAWTVFKSMVNILSRGGVEWRGTVYSLEELRKHTL